MIEINVAAFFLQFLAFLIAFLVDDVPGRYHNGVSDSDVFYEF